jgi:hypothetical protein
MNYQLDNEGRMFFTADSFDRSAVYCNNVVEDNWNKLAYATADSVSSSFSDLESKIEVLTKKLEELEKGNVNKNKLRSQLKTLNY